MTAQRNTASVQMFDGRLTRISLPAPVATYAANDASGMRLGTGYYVTAVYVSPRAKRVVIKTYSQWQDDSRTGRSIGTRYLLADADLRARLCAMDDDLSESIDAVFVPETLDDATV